MQLTFLLLEGFFKYVSMLNLYGLLFKIGGGLVIGLIAGYLIKKAIGLLIFLIAIYAGSLLWFNYEGIVTIHQTVLEENLLSIDPLLTGQLGMYSSIGIFSVAILIGLGIGIKLAGSE